MGVFILFIIVLIIVVSVIQARSKASKANTTVTTNKTPIKQIENTPAKEESSSNYGIIFGENISINAANIKDIQENFIAFDLETTGLSEFTNDIIEVGAVKFVNGVEVDRYGTLVNIGRHIPAEATRVNHITDRMIENDGRNPEEVYKEFVEFIKEAFEGKSVLVAHNAEFDMGFIKKTLGKYGYKGTLNYIDTLKLARKNVKGLENYKQPTVAGSFGITNSAEHRAVSDAETCGKMFIELLKLEEAGIQKKVEKATKAVLNEEEKEIGAVILDILEKADFDISKFRFHKNSSGYIDIVHVYTIWKYKVAKKGNYIILPVEVARKSGLKMEPCIKSEGYENIRTFFDNPFELDRFSSYFSSSYQKYLDYGNSASSSSFNRYEKEFFESVEMTEIPDIPGYISKARQRMIDSESAKAEMEAQLKEKEEEKLRKQQEREEKRLISEKAEIEKERVKKELLENAGNYTIDMIKSIVEFSNAENKRAVIKMDDDGNIYKIYESISDASKDAEIAPKTIRDVANGKYKHGGGFVWKYADEYVEMKGE